MTDESETLVERIAWAMVNEMGMRNPIPVEIVDGGIKVTIRRKTDMMRLARAALAAMPSAREDGSGDDAADD